MNPTRALRRSLGAALLGASVLATSGCALLTPKTPEQQVSSRALEYWQARKTTDFEKAYQFSAPSYRKLHTAQQFRMQFGAGATFNAVAVNKVTCQPERCEVQMKLSVTPAVIGLKMGPLDTYLNEVWVLESGQWWHFQELE